MNVCRVLEEGLELMREEFESMEVYWRAKLENERRFYEAQLASSEAQFCQLETRIQEYEAGLAAGNTQQQV